MLLPATYLFNFPLTGPQQRSDTMVVHQLRGAGVPLLARETLRPHFLPLEVTRMPRASGGKSSRLADIYSIAARPVAHFVVPTHHRDRNPEQYVPLGARAGGGEVCVVETAGLRTPYRPTIEHSSSYPNGEDRNPTRDAPKVHRTSGGATFLEERKYPRPQAILPEKPSATRTASVPPHRRQAPYPSPAPPRAA
jgi:hypothetical protein